MDGEISFKEHNEMLMKRARNILEKEPSKKEKEPASIWTIYLCEKVEPYYYENGKETKGGFYEIETPKGEENVCGYVI